MCGLVGFLDFTGSEASSQSVLDSMVGTLLHRGPDDNNIYYEDKGDKEYCLGLGHTRLSIIDLSVNAGQPMHLGDELVMVFNGEIYNYIELRNELKSYGYVFSTSSDTEVILYAYKHWGTSCFNFFNGMWAIAIWDKQKEKLVLSRDRFGKKHLYYYHKDGLIIFASELKALFKHPAVPKIENEEKISRYLAYNYRYIDIDNDSFFKNIYHVPKSSFFEISSKNELLVNQYWALDTESEKEQIDDHEAKNKFKDLLIDAVSLRLRSDVPVGCLLSGGLDSSSIAVIASRVLGKPIEFYSGITSKGVHEYDESQYIEVLKKKIGMKHKYITPNPNNLLDTLGEMLSYHDEPVCTVTWYNLYLICKQISEDNIHVLLNGHGGDELLAGYWDHYHYNLFDLKTAHKDAYLSEKNAWLENHQRNPGEIDYYSDFISNNHFGEGNEASRHGLYISYLNENYRELFKRDFRLTQPSNSLLKSRLHSEMINETIPSSLRAEDRNTMAFSIESRSPFIDYRLAEFCFSLPNKFKIRGGIGKWLLRESMENILPDEIRLRKDKAGFIAPADIWFRTVNKNEILDLINSSNFRSSKYLDVKKVKQLFEEHVLGKKNHHMFLWQMINVELWLRKNF